jgi:hypothetical protein
LHDNPNPPYYDDRWCTQCFDKINDNKFYFTLVGDFNGDYTVNSTDVSFLAECWGTHRGEDEFYPACDITGDGVIGLNDLASLAKNLGKSRYSQTQYSLTIIAGTGGTTYPESGTDYYYDGMIAGVIALANSGYEFDYWLLDGVLMTGNPTTVRMTQSRTLAAHFRNAGTGGCPTLVTWNGTDYAEESTLPIHSEGDVTLRHRISNTMTLKDNVYVLQLQELDNFTSHIDRVRLFAVDGDGEFHPCMLLYAKRNTTNVLLELLFDDENRVDLTPNQTIELKFLPSAYPKPTVYYVFEINGYNPKPIIT